MSRGLSCFACLLLTALALAGCATPRAPVTAPVERLDYSVVEPERGRLLAAFQGMLARQRDCPASVAANLTVTYKSWLRSGAVSGFLQAMSPSFLKFVAVTPLGQPFLLLATDGDQFHYIDVGQAKVFEGPVRTETFNHHAPQGFTPEYGYYWLIGRPWPGQVTITAVTRDPEDRGYWFELNTAATPASRLLFDPERQLVLRHELLDDAGQRLSSVVYDGHSDGLCPLPGRISIETSSANGTLTLIPAWDETDRPLAEQDFELDLPSGFQRIFVK